MARTLLDNYDDFNFMVILLFLYFVLMAFIIIIIINAKNNAKNNPRNVPNTTQNCNSKTNNTYPQTTYFNPIPTLNPDIIYPTIKSILY